jgi:hypothetical protein
LTLINGFAKKGLMKTLRLFGFALFASLMVIPEGHAAKTPIDFSPFRGTYASTYLVSDSNSTGTGNATVQVTSKKRGASIVIRITGSVLFNGNSLPLLATVKVDQKRVTSDSVLLGYSGQPIQTLPARYSGRKRAFTFTSIVTPGATFGGNPVSGSVTYTLRFGKRTISFGGSGALTISGSTFTTIVQISGTKRK